MHLYLDSADRRSCVTLLRTGLFAGLTTNPTILQRAGLGVDAIPEVHRWATDAGAPLVFLQTWGQSTEAMVHQGLQLRELGERVVVKIVANHAGTAACAELSRRGVPTLLTAVYSPAQALLAAAAGADYIAPYLGKLNDAGHDGLAVVGLMQQVLSATESQTQVLLASIRDTESVVAGAQLGIRHFTMNPTVARALFEDKATDAAVEAFDAAVQAGGVTSRA